MKRFHFGTFFIYTPIIFGFAALMVWIVSFCIDIPVLPIAGIIAVIAGVCISYGTDENDASLYGSSHKKSSSEKSVIGHAVVGHIIAGPVGGVVGAIHAADSNAKSRSNRNE